MGIYIEQEPSGPSKLDQRLDTYKRPETGHIMLTPADAARELAQSLLAFYRGNKAGNPPPLNETSSKIEALAAIFEERGERNSSGLYDFDEVRSSIESRREQLHTEKFERETAHQGWTPKEPPQAEF